MKIYPTEQILKYWSENYYNNFDLFLLKISLLKMKM